MRNLRLPIVCAPVVVVLMSLFVVVCVVAFPSWAQQSSVPDAPADSTDAPIPLFADEQSQTEDSIPSAVSRDADITAQQLSNLSPEAVNEARLLLNEPSRSRLNQAQRESQRVFPLSTLIPEERRSLDQQQAERNSLRDLQERASRQVPVETNFIDVPDYQSRSPELGFANTTEVLSYLRFVAFSMEDAENRDNLLSGLVGGFLRLGRSDLAIEEIDRQQSIYWKINSRSDLAQYYIDEDRIEEAIVELGEIEGILRDHRVEQTRRRLQDSSELIRVSPVQLDLVVSRAATLMGYVGEVFQALTISEYIGNLSLRNNTVLSIAETAVTDPRLFKVRMPRSLIRLLVNNEFGLVKQKTHPLHADVQIYERMARIADGLGDREFSSEILRFARDDVVGELPVGSQGKQLVEILPLFVRVGQYSEAMEGVRQIESEVDVAMALAQIGRAVGQFGQVEDAIPLFLYAIDIASSAAESGDRDAVFRDIASAQSVIGRFRDAYNTARQIRNQETRFEAFADVAKQLINFNQLDGAALLARDSLPFMRQRAPLLAAIAVKKAENGDVEGFESGLVSAYTSPGGGYNVGLEVDDLRPIIQAQLIYGNPENDLEVFGGVRDLVLSADDSYLQTYTILEIASAQVMRNDVLEARKSLNTALQIAVSSRTAEQFSEAILRIVDVQIMLGDLLGAFDSVALLDTPFSSQIVGGSLASNSPLLTKGSVELLGEDLKYRGLQKVAAAAVAAGEMELALRAAREVLVETVQAQIYSQIAQSIAEYIVGDEGSSSSGAETASERAGDSGSSERGI